MVAEQRKGGVASGVLGGTAIKPPERHGMDKIKYLIHDPDKGEYFTRTPKSWALITIFYCIYYSCLAAFWYGMLQLFFITLPLDSPKWQLDDGIIGTNPGVGMRPGQPDSRIDSSMLLLHAKAKDETPTPDFESTSNIDWAKRYEVFLKKFDNTTDTADCSGDDYNEEGSPACKFDASILERCSEFPYGYELIPGEEAVQPCVLIKINRIYGWKPEPYGAGEVDSIEDMPDKVKNLIKANPNKLYLDCDGENPADREALSGNMAYFPNDQGISFKYFPYTQAHRNYHNPVVAVKFKSVPIGQLLHIECKLWAKGMKHSSKDRLGQVHFELLLE